MPKALTELENKIAENKNKTFVQPKANDALTEAMSKGLAKMSRANSDQESNWSDETVAPKASSSSAIASSSNPAVGSRGN